MIHLVTFDLDDTLWDVAQVMNHAETTLRQWLGVHAPKLGEVPIEHLWVFRNQLLAEEPSLKFRLSELRYKVLERALLAAGYLAPEAQRLAAEGFEVFLAARHAVTFFANAEQTLRALSQQYQLAVITNGNADVSRLGLGEYFRFAISAESLGVGKPHAAPFAKALELSGVAAKHALHIGDHPIDDMQGAKQAGFHAVWFNPSAKPWTGEHTPDAEISALNQLPALLANWPKP